MISGTTTQSELIASTQPPTMKAISIYPATVKLTISQTRETTTTASPTEIAPGTFSIYIYYHLH